MRVLVATADDCAARIVESVVQELGHQPLRCTNGRDAYRSLRNEGCLLGILDTRLESLPSVEIAQRIRGQTGGDRPYLLMLADEGDPDDASHALEAGADDYLVKPIRPAELRLRLRMALKRLVQRLDARERLHSFEELLETSSELIQTARPDGRLLFANRAWQDAMGLDEEDLQGATIFDRIAPDQRDRFTKAFRRVLREQGSVHLETAFITRDGERIPVEGSLRVKVRGRAPTSVRAHFHDVSRRKRMEAVLHTVLKGTSGTTGDDFFRALARHIADSIGARCGLVGEVDTQGTPTLRTLAIWNGEAFIPPTTIPLRFEDSDAGGTEDVRPRYFLSPTCLAELDATSYLSTQMTDGRGRVTGLLCLLHDRPMQLGPEALHVLSTFAQRAGAELERVKAQGEIEHRERLSAALAAFEQHLLGWRGGWAELTPALAHLGAEVGVSRAYIFDSFADARGEARTSMRAEWCEKGISPAIGDPETQDLRVGDMSPDVGTRLLAGELVARNTKVCTGRFAEILMRQSVVSFANAPIFHGERFIGYLGFDDCAQERRWTQAECDLLVSAATALSLALDRHEAQSRLENILRSLTDVVWSIGAQDHERIYLSTVVEHVLGHPAEAFYEDPELWCDMVHEEDRPRVLAFADDILARGSAELEYRMIRPDGSVRWIRDRGRVTRDPRGQPVRIDGIATDVTVERGSKLRTEAFSSLGRQLLRATTPKQAARTIFEVADELIGWDSCWMDLGDPLDVAQMQPVLYMDEIDGMRREVMPSIVSTGLRELAARVVREGGCRLEREGADDPGFVAFGDPERRSQSMLAVPIQGNDEIVGLLSIQSYQPERYALADLDTLRSLAAYCAGVLTRAKAQQRVEEAERRGRAMLDAMPDLVFRIDREGRYLDYRASDADMLVGDTDGLVGSLLSNRLPLDVAAAWMATIHRVLVEQTVQRFEYDLEIRGVLRHFDARVAPLGESEVLVVARDITARRRAEEERLALERDVLEGHRLESLGVLAGGIAHDFNNLLTSIMGYASLARMKSPADSTLAKYLLDIEDATQSAAELALLMLAYSGKGQFVVQALDLGDIATGTEGLLYSELLKLRSVMTTEVPDELPAIEGDQTQLQQVMLNLTLNGAQSMRPDGGIVHVRLADVEMAGDDFEGCYVGDDLPAGRYVRLEVADSGCGMSSETQARIFDPFFTTKDGGRGLGLAAVVGIVRGHGGAMRVASVPDQGTTFSLFFPVSGKSVVRDGRDKEPLSDGRDGLVLVIDDEIGVRRLTRDILENAGFRVLVAEDGAAGVAAFREHADEVCAVLLDMTMPRMGGVEAFGVLRGIQPDLPVLVSSGYSETEAVNRFEGQTPSGFIQKPYRATALLRKLQEILVSSESEAHA